LMCGHGPFPGELEPHDSDRTRRSKMRRRSHSRNLRLTERSLTRRDKRERGRHASQIHAAYMRPTPHPSFTNPGDVEHCLRHVVCRNRHTDADSRAAWEGGGC
jgi:hypothetical protein